MLHSKLNVTMKTEGTLMRKATITEAKGGVQEAWEQYANRLISSVKLPVKYNPQNGVFDKFTPDTAYTITEAKVTQNPRDKQYFLSLRFELFGKVLPSPSYSQETDLTSVFIMRRLSGHFSSPDNYLRKKIQELPPVKALIKLVESARPVLLPNGGSFGKVSFLKDAKHSVKSIHAVLFEFNITTLIEDNIYPPGINESAINEARGGVVAAWGEYLSAALKKHGPYYIKNVSSLSSWRVEYEAEGSLTAQPGYTVTQGAGGSWMHLFLRWDGKLIEKDKETKSKYEIHNVYKLSTMKDILSSFYVEKKLMESCPELVSLNKWLLNTDTRFGVVIVDYVIEEDKFTGFEIVINTETFEKTNSYPPGVNEEMLNEYRGGAAEAWRQYFQTELRNWKYPIKTTFWENFQIYPWKRMDCVISVDSIEVRPQNEFYVWFTVRGNGDIFTRIGTPDKTSPSAAKKVTDEDIAELWGTEINYPIIESLLKEIPATKNVGEYSMGAWGVSEGDNNTRRFGVLIYYRGNDVLPYPSEMNEETVMRKAILRSTCESAEAVEFLAMVLEAEETGIELPPLTEENVIEKAKKSIRHAKAMKDFEKKSKESSDQDAEDEEDEKELRMKKGTLKALRHAEATAERYGENDEDKKEIKKKILSKAGVSTKGQYRENAPKDKYDDDYLSDRKEFETDSYEEAKGKAARNKAYDRHKEKVRMKGDEREFADKYHKKDYREKVRADHEKAIDDAEKDMADSEKKSREKATATVKAHVNADKPSQAPKKGHEWKMVFGRWAQVRV
jgi:hypothetical protein